MANKIIDILKHHILDSEIDFHQGYNRALLKVISILEGDYDDISDIYSVIANLEVTVTQIHFQKYNIKPVMGNNTTAGGYAGLRFARKIINENSNTIKNKEKTK